MPDKNENNRFLQYAKKFHLLITQHLNDEELLSFSTCTASLQMAFKYCRHCLSRLTVHMCVDKLHQIDRLHYILKSERRYHNFKLTCGNSEELSVLFMDIMSCFYETIVRVEVNGVSLPTNKMELHLPELKFLKVSFSNLNALHVLLGSGRGFRKLQVENIVEPIIDRRFIEQMMRFWSVQLINMDCIDMNIIKNLDFVYSNCVDFKFESNRKSDYDNLAKLFEIMRLEQLNIRWLPRGLEGYRLTVHRIVRKEYIEVPVIELYERRKRQKVENDRTGDLDRITPQYFHITLEISELSWNFMKKIGYASKELTVLNIFELSRKEMRNFFLNFKNLQKIVVASGAENGTSMETEVTTTRDSMVIRPSRKDPLYNIPLDLLDHVFKHFNRDDFQKAATVSATWNNIISKSPRYMKMLKLSMKNLKAADVDVILRSLKHFEDLEISGGSKPKLVPIVLKIVNYFSNFLTTLSLHQLNVRRVKSFYIPNLKNLKLHTVSENIPGSFFDCCSTLKSLKLQNMRIKERYYSRIHGQKQLEKLSFVDCFFLDIKHKRFENSINMKTLKYLEIGLYMAHLCQKNENAEFIETLFETNEAFRNVEELALNGFRGKLMGRILKKCKNLKKLEMQNFWWKDFQEFKENEEVKTYEMELYIQNQEFFERLNWEEMFPKVTKIYAGMTIEPKEAPPIDETYNNFLKCMSLSGKRMIKNKTFVPGHPIYQSPDPLQSVPADIHDYIFQHLTYSDISNALQVSRSWNVLCKSSKSLMDKIVLKLPRRDNREETEFVYRAFGNYQNISVSSFRFGFVHKFNETVRNLTVYCCTVNNNYKPAAFEFTNLESLEIYGEASSNATDKVLDLLEFFMRTKKLKKLIIMEQMDNIAVPHFFEILRNNKDLKHLRVEQITYANKYMEQDWTKGIEFKLEKLRLGFTESDMKRGNTEQLLKFVQLHRSTCEELILSYSSMQIIYEAFANFPKLHTFYGKMGFEKDSTEIPVNVTIKTCVLPSELSLPDVKYFVERLPNVERMFVSRLDDAAVQAISTNLLFLKFCSYNTDFERCIKNYRQRSGVMRDQINTSIEFVKLKDMKFKEMYPTNLFFGSSKFKVVNEPRRNRNRFDDRNTGPRGRQRHWSDEDPLDDDDDDEIEDREEFYFRR